MCTILTSRLLQLALVLGLGVAGVAAQDVDAAFQVAINGSAGAYAADPGTQLDFSAGRNLTKPATIVVVASLATEEGGLDLATLLVLDVRDCAPMQGSEFSLKVPSSAPELRLAVQAFAIVDGGEVMPSEITILKIRGAATH